MKINYISTLIIFFYVFPLIGQSDGELDLTFGNDGIVITNNVFDEDRISSIDIQKDGKIVVLGTSEVTGGQRYTVVRYHSFGILDNSFGDNGKVKIEINPDYAQVRHTIKEVDDEKLLLMLFDDEDFVANLVLTRLNSNGTIDETFGDNGYTIYKEGSDDVESGTRLFVLDNRSILVSGRAEGTRGVLKFNENGILDTSFGENGFKVLPNEALLEAADGNFYIQQYASDKSSVLYRYDNNLDADETFGNNGMIEIPIPDVEQPINGNFYMGDFKVQIDGKLLTLGLIENNDNNSLTMFVSRFLDDGQPDESFGDNGVSIINIWEWSRSFPNSIELLSEGKILVWGTAYRTNPFTGGDFMVVKLNPDGTLDDTFIFNDNTGNNGKVTTDLEGHDDAYAIAIQNDGKIILAGEANSGLSDTKFGLVRYHNSNGPVSSINKEPIKRIKVNPNPVFTGDLLNLQIELEGLNELKLELIDINGKSIVSSEIKNLNQGFHTVQLKIPHNIQTQIVIAIIYNSNSQVLGKERILILKN